MQELQSDKECGTDLPAMLGQGCVLLLPMQASALGKLLLRPSPQNQLEVRTPFEGVFYLFD